MKGSSRVGQVWGNREYVIYDDFSPANFNLCCMVLSSMVTLSYHFPVENVFRVSQGFYPFPVQEVPSHLSMLTGSLA